MAWCPITNATRCVTTPGPIMYRLALKNSLKRARDALPPGKRRSLNRVVQERNRSEEHTCPSLMRISYAVFCLKKKNKQDHTGGVVDVKQRAQGTLQNLAALSDGDAHQSDATASLA